MKILDIIELANRDIHIGDKVLVKNLTDGATVWNGVEGIIYQIGKFEIGVVVTKDHTSYGNKGLGVKIIFPKNWLVKLS